VIVTHDARVAAYADRVAMVRDGLVTSIDLPSASSASGVSVPAGIASAAAPKGVG
jgi:ABC-type lipoprotein export system ATPase subunit